MWFKDSKGNWYMAGQEPIECGYKADSSWKKDESGSWYLDVSGVSRKEYTIQDGLPFTGGQVRATLG